MSQTPRNPPHASPSAPDRILEAFAERARVGGPRSVVMADLARELGISTRTLYQRFPSKADLVMAMMESWADRLARDQERRLRHRMPPLASMTEAAVGWIEARERFSPIFWRDLAREYPEAARLFRRRVRANMERARKRLIPLMRRDLATDLALELLLEMVQLATDTDRCERVGLTRREAARAALELWARGALASGGGASGHLELVSDAGEAGSGAEGTPEGTERCPAGDDGSSSGDE